MDCKPEKENLLLAYRDKFTSIKQTYPEWSDTDVRLQTAADLRPQFRLNRDAGYRENLGLSEYEVPEAAFTLTEDGSVRYTKYGQELLELHERQLRLTPDAYSPEEHAISLLIEEHFKQGATYVVTSYGDRDLVVMHFDPITKLGTTEIVDATKQQSTVQEIAKKRYAHLESLHLTDKIFFFTDKKLSMQHATEVIEPIMKQRMKTKLRFEGVQQFVSIHQKQEDKHIQPPFYNRLFAYADDSFRQKGQILPETQASVAPKKLEPEHVVKPAKTNPFAHLPRAQVYGYDKRQYGWFDQKRIWDNSVRPWIIHGELPIQKQNTMKEHAKNFEISQYEVKIEPTQTVGEMIFPNDHQEKIPQDIPKIIFQANSKSTREPELITEQQEVKPDLVLPVATFVTKVDIQAVPTYNEKVIAISIPVHHQKYIEQTAQQYISVEDHVTVVVQPQIKDHRGVVLQQMMQEETWRNDVVYEVDQLMIADMQTVTESIGKQIQRGESVKVVTKLVWMMKNDQFEFVPVEEVEIAQDSTRTLQNLLHFLRKVVRKYCGEDSIRQRIIQQIASDKWDDEIGEIAEYLTILKAQWMYRHLFAVVN